MDVTYYPGCSLESSAREYNESIKAVCAALDIRLHELCDWTCCGATSAHSLDEDLALSLPALNLSKAEQSGNNMLVPCPLCYNRLKRAQKAAVKSDIDIYDLASFMGQTEWIEKIRSRVKSPLNAVKAVCYYGCMSNRPPKVTENADYENPCDMDNIASALGIDVRPWSYKTDCCGASFSVSRPDIVHTLVKKLYDKALETDAECIIVSCQMCQANLDLYQKEISMKFGRNYKIPIFYFTELIGLAFGLKGISTWLKRHMVDPISFLKERKLLNLK
ncbi:MAG: CoB--CoM heterodisulfide reductase iron-sulfur subunit B family protein [Deltaproteobacteria bacterium]|nr:CoB--CoM heterodisulfide reductase iron-sulfur subunit B family protein [Deltaproteobacteria bacterium]MBW2660588.1 CoB--CoM heterodisulfide reductase iron-sulfur subunit B family protein [Deltaproteobacteria bacterium]